METEKAVGTKQYVQSWRLLHTNDKIMIFGKRKLAAICQFGCMKLKCASYINRTHPLGNFKALECTRVLRNKIPNWPKWSSFLRALSQWLTLLETKEFYLMRQKAASSASICLTSQPIDNHSPYLSTYDNSDVATKFNCFRGKARWSCRAWATERRREVEEWGMVFN